MTITNYFQSLLLEKLGSTVTGHLGAHSAKPRTYASVFSTTYTNQRKNKIDIPLKGNLSRTAAHGVEGAWLLAGNHTLQYAMKLSLNARIQVKSILLMVYDIICLILV